MNRLSRRRFLERVGLGAGASLVASVGDSVLARAAGEATAPKRVVFVLWSNGVPRPLVTPAAAMPGAGTNPDEGTFKRATASAVLPGMRDFPWPTVLAPLEKHRQRMLIIDNLTNKVNYEHSPGYGALAAINGDSRPGGITIDQHIARQIGAASVLKSLNWGVGNIHSGTRQTEAVIFASGAQRPLPHVIQPEVLFRRVFTETNPAAYTDAAKRRALLMEPLRARLRRLSTALAAPERRTLEHYSAALEDYDERLKAVKPVACGAPAAPGAMTAIEDRLAAMNEMSILALSCGLTNVIGVSVSCGYAHSAAQRDKLGQGTPLAGMGKLDYWGHEPRNYAPAMTIIPSHVFGLVARMADAWSKIPDGNGTLLDSTTIVMLSDSGGTVNGHHRPFTMGWPVVILGNAGGALKADGRFLRYDQDTRSLGDLWSTIATACGVPTKGLRQGWGWRGDRPAAGDPGLARRPGAARSTSGARRSIRTRCMSPVLVGVAIAAQDGGHANQDTGAVGGSGSAVAGKWIDVERVLPRA